MNKLKLRSGADVYDGVWSKHNGEELLIKWRPLTLIRKFMDINPRQILIHVFASSLSAFSKAVSYMLSFVVLLNQSFDIYNMYPSSACS